MKRLSSLLLITTCSFIFFASTHVTSNEYARPEIENVRAFAKLYGYVRYFHPSDEAADINWDRFAVHGVREVQGAGTTAELLTTLRDLFGPIAPMLQIYSEEDGPPPPPAELVPKDTSGLAVVAWQHRGVGLDMPYPAYESRRLNRASASAAPRAPFGVLMQTVDATRYRGRTIRLTADARAEVDGHGGNQVQLWLRVDRTDRQMGFFDNMDDRPITSSVWDTYQISGPIAEDAAAVAFGVFLLGSGKGMADDFVIEVQHDTGEWERLSIANPGFEEGGTGAVPPGWMTNGQGYTFATAATGEPHGHIASIETEPEELAVRQPLFPTVPEPGTVLNKPIGSGLAVQFPVALFDRDGHTVGKPDPQNLERLMAELDGIDIEVLTASNENLRLANVLIAWNVLQHFYPYFDVVDTDWDAALSTALHDAEDDADARDFTRTLERMLAKLHDGHAGARHATMQNLASLPILLDLVENRIVIVATGDTTLFNIGDVVISIDGVPADRRLNEMMQYQSGSTQWRRLGALSGLTVGRKGTATTLVLRRGGEDIKVSATHDFTGRLSEPRPEAVAELEPDIYYVNLAQAELSEINERMDDLSSAEGVVFDLRGYPNGTHSVLQHLTEESLRSAHWQIPQILYPDQEDLVGYDTTGRWMLPPAEPRINGKVVFLTNERAISYAESVMGIVEHYHLGEIIGRPTAGTNGNVNTIALPGGFSVRFTGMRVLKHDGSQHHLVGILPTIPLERTLDAVKSGRDEGIEKALEVIHSASQE